MTVERRLGTLASRAVVAAALVAAGAARAQEGSPATLILGRALSEPRAYEKVAHLADRIGPRLSGSAGYDAAVRWAVEEFRRDGLERVWTEKVTVPRWVRGEERVRIVAPVDASLTAVALGMSVPTPEGGIEAEVVEVDGFEALSAVGEKARGKIVLFNRPFLRDAGPEWGYGAASALRHRGGVEAARLGAVGALIRSIGTARYRLAHTGMTGREDGVPGIPYAAVSQEDADHLHRLLAAGETVRVRMTLGCRTEPDVEQANVLAEIRGQERPEEVVVIGRHLDSWDLGTGAVDDGAGCAIVMESLRIVRSLGLAPRRTLRAVLFANEENGLRGGKAYAEAHAAELGLHAAAIEADSGAGRATGFGVTAGEGGEEIARRIARPLSGIGAAEISKGGGGADISPMRPAGVPMLLLRQETERYFDYHHSAADTLDKVDARDLALATAAMAVMAYGLADSEEALPRLEPQAPPSPGVR